MPINEKSKNQNNAPPIYGCIWCGSKPLSREHLWPEWFSKIIPKTRSLHEHFRINSEFANGILLIHPSLKKRTGDPASRQLKVVCALCNKTWMSDIENQAKQVMGPMIIGSKIKITPEQQKILRDWITLKAIIGEYDDPKSITIDKDTREQFYKQRTLKGTWKIYVGSYIGKDWITRRRHNTFCVLPDSFTESTIIKKNAQCTTMVGGRLLMHAIWSSTNRFDSFTFQDTIAEKLYQIHPESNTDVDWPSKTTLGDEDAEVISQSIGTIN